MEHVRRADDANNTGIILPIHDMFCEWKGVGGPVADKGDTAPGHQGDDDAKAEKKDKTDTVGGGLEAPGANMNSINAFGCES